MGVNTRILVAFHLPASLFQYFQILVGGGPGGDEATDDFVGVAAFPNTEGEVAAQMVELLLGEDHELLVGGGSDGKWYVVRNEYFLETFSHADGVMAHTEIEIIGEKGVKLQAEHSAFSQ